MAPPSPNAFSFNGLCNNSFSNCNASPPFSLARPQKVPCPRNSMKALVFCQSLCGISCCLECSSCLEVLGFFLSQSLAPNPEVSLHLALREAREGLVGMQPGPDGDYTAEAPPGGQSPWPKVVSEKHTHRHTFWLWCLGFSCLTIPTQWHSDYTQRTHVKFKNPCQKHGAQSWQLS